MDQPILSIIIPSYNTSKYVDECLPTFIDERLFGKVVIYLIDDGATDNTKEKIMPYVEKYPQLFKFIHKENGGHGSVINYGVHKIVKTKYFKLIDGDDWVSSNALFELVNYLEKTNSDLVLSDYARVYTSKTVKFEYFNKPKVLKKINKVDILLHTCTFKTEIFINNNIRVRENVFFDDVEYVVFPFLYIKTVSYINSCVYYYRLGSATQSVSSSSMVRHYKDIENVTHDIAIYLNSIKMQNPTFYKKNLEYCSQCLGAYYFVLTNVCRKESLRKTLIEADTKLLLESKELRNKIKYASFYSRIFFFSNFKFCNLIKGN